MNKLFVISLIIAGFMSVSLALPVDKISQEKTAATESNLKMIQLKENSNTSTITVNAAQIQKSSNDIFSVVCSSFICICVNTISGNIDLNDSLKIKEVQCASLSSGKYPEPNWLK